MEQTTSSMLAEMLDLLVEDQDRDRWGRTVAEVYADGERVGDLRLNLDA